MGSSPRGVGILAVKIASQAHNRLGAVDYPEKCGEAG